MTAKDCCVLGLLMAAGAFAAAYPGSDPDTYLHLAAGRQIVENLGPVRVESLTTLSQGKPFVNHEWLYDVALYGATTLAGPETGVTLFRMLLSGLLFMFSGLAAIRMGADRRIALVAALAFLPLFRLHLDARPHVAGYALTAIQFAVVAGYARPGAAASRIRSEIAAGVVLVLTSMLWANVHGSFPLALGICAFWVLSPADPTSNRRIRLVATVMVAAAFFVNPWGPGLLQTIFHHAEPAYRTLVPEWGPYPWGEEPIRDLSLMTLTAAGLLSFLPAVNRRRVPELLLFAVFIGMTVTSRKFMLGLAAVCVPIMAANLSRHFAGRARIATLVAGAAMCVAQWPAIDPGWSIGKGFDLDNFPADSVSRLRREGAHGTVFCPLHQGGFIEWSGGSRLKPFIDGRAYVHGLDGISTYIGALGRYDNFRELDSRYHFSAVLIELSDPAFPRLTDGLGSDPSWDLVDLDSRFAVFVPAGSGKPDQLRPYRFLKATTDPRYLFEIGDADMAAALAEAERVLAGGAGTEAGLLSRGVLKLRASGMSWRPDEFVTRAQKSGGETPNSAGGPDRWKNCSDALHDLSRLADIRRDVPMFRYFEGLAAACAGRCSDAVRILEETPIPDARILAAGVRRSCL
jgi:hypothetical protein